jgi:putative ABC transport system permease protein
MKYFPLIWAALWRKPARTILTLLSAVAAFTLFGLAIGVNATYAGLLEQARADRVLVNPRFDGTLTLAQRDRIAHMDGVVQIGASEFFVGYYRDPKDRVLPIFMDHGMRGAWPELPLTPAQWDQLEANPSGVFLDNHTAARLGLKAGNAMPLLTTAPSRRDGSKLWLFHVLGVVENLPSARGGLVMANFDYFDSARPIEEAGQVAQLNVLLKDPDRANEITGQIDAIFANSPNPTWSVTDKALSENSISYQYNIPLVTEGVATAGLFMILFLIGNGIAQSVRERIAEFAVLKTLGFSDAGVMALVFVEAAIPCLMGAAAGFAIALALATKIAGLSVLQKMLVVPPSLSAGVLALGFGFAILVAFASAVIPALRLRRLDVATALRR